MRWCFQVANLTLKYNLYIYPEGILNPYHLTGSMLDLGDRHAQNSDQFSLCGAQNLLISLLCDIFHAPKNPELTSHFHVFSHELKMAAHFTDLKQGWQKTLSRQLPSSRLL